MTDARTPLLASVIIEWENVRLSELDRCRRMLRALAAQIVELHGPTAAALLEPGLHPLVAEFEIIVLYNNAAIAGSDVERVVSAEIPSTTPHCTWRLVPASGEGYYAQKNFGASRASGDILVFIDSDVVPEPGWLANMLAPMNEPRCQVVAGHAYLDPERLIGRTFALVWFFPLRSEVARLGPTSWFFANCVAFRRECFLAHPYVLIAGSARGACTQLAHELTAAGIPILLNTAAQVSHPAPNGLRHLFLRGLAQGRDELLKSQLQHRRGLASLAHSVAWICKWELRALRKIILNYRRVGMPLWQVPAAMSIATAFWLLFPVGDIATRLFPERMKAAIQL
jgi:hypothetical protein